MDIKTIEVAGNKAIATLNDYRARYAKTGEYPFLIGDPDDWERVQEAIEGSSTTIEEILRATDKIDVVKWLVEQRQEAEKYEFSEKDELGDWPGEIAEKGSYTIHVDLGTNTVKPKVLIGLTRIKESWHLPAVMKYGSWNACPEPALHCAIHRKWQTQFGAQIVGMSADVIECHVEKPPTDRKAALTLAWEQYWYCCDIVVQGVGTVNNLAATLLNSKYWYFWWD